MRTISVVAADHSIFVWQGVKARLLRQHDARMVGETEEVVAPRQFAGA